MQSTQSRVAIAQRRHDHPKCNDVGELSKVEVLGLHLLPDRIRCFDPSVDLNVLQPNVTDVFSQLPNDVDCECIPLLPQELRTVHDGLACFGHQMGEGKVFELFLQIHHPDTTSEWGVDFQGLRRDTSALLRLLDEVKRSHVIQTV